MPNHYSLFIIPYYLPRGGRLRIETVGLKEFHCEDFAVAMAVGFKKFKFHTAHALKGDSMKSIGKIVILDKLGINAAFVLYLDLIGANKCSYG